MAKGSKKVSSAEETSEATPLEENAIEETAQAVAEIDAPIPGKEESIDEMTTLHERTIAALSYISFLAIIPFYLKKESKFCRFHGKQGLLVAIIFHFASLLMVLDLVHDLVMLLQFAIFVRMGFAALAGRWQKLPWVYDAACKIEEQLSIKTKEEEAEDVALRPDQVRPEEK